MTSKPVTVHSIPEMPENRAKRRQISGHSFRLASVALAGLSLLLVTSGCGGGSNGGAGGGSGGSGSGGSGGGSGAASIFVTQDNAFFLPPSPSTILQFSTAANGDVNPNSTITGPSQVIFTALAADAAARLYVGGSIFNSNPDSVGSVEILVYSAGANGTANPARTITGSATGLNVDNQNGIEALAVDSSGNIYVNVIYSPSNGVAFPAIAVYPSTANGNVAPMRVIGGSATTIAQSSPNQIALDSAGNIYVPGGAPLFPDSILIFNSSATGNVLPTSTLTGAATMLDDVVGVALDSAGNIYVANGSIMGSTPSILEFGAGSTGNAAPIRTISGAATTMNAIGNLGVDSAGNIYLLTPDGVLKFATGATGNVAPAATITTSSGFGQSTSLIVVQ